MNSAYHQGNNWPSEREAQMHYGRQMGDEEAVGVSSRPIGSFSHDGDSRVRSGQFGGQRPRRDFSSDRGGYQPHRENFNRNAQDGNQDDKQRATGHLAFLKAIQHSGGKVRLVTILDEEVIGVVKGCDETTISLRIPCATAENPNAYQNRVFFKQNLVEFAPVVDGVTFS